MSRFLQGGLLWAYRVVFAHGLLRYRWGQRLYFYLYDAYKLLLEAGPISQLHALVPSATLVIDVGANVGFFTRRFARWVGAQGRVIAIEPEAMNFAELSRRIASEGHSDRVVLYQAVADRAAGEVRLVINEDHPGDHRIGRDGVPVPAVTLDALLAGETRKVALIKIDVQGAEIRVLMGAENVLTRDRPALLVEVDPAALARFDGDVESLLALLYRFEYVPHALEHDGFRPLTRPTLKELLARRSYVDVLFIANRRS